MTTAKTITLKEESILMGLLDKILGVSSRKPKKVVTDPVALDRIERTQQELAVRLDMLDERIERVEAVLPLPPPPLPHTKEKP